MIPLPSPFMVMPRWTKLDITTSDILTSCEDLKVLGKGDFKALIKWRKSLREEVRCP